MSAISKVCNMARVQYSQNINHITADLINHNVVRVHDVFTRANNATGPKQIRHERKVLGRLNDGSMKALSGHCIALLDVIGDFHQVGGSFLRPPDGLHGLCAARRA